MNFVCYSCGKSLSGEVDGGRVPRGHSCPGCKRDTRVCRNCKHYDQAAYNQCRESSAERVVDKERANFCDYFTFSDRAAAKGGGKSDVLKKLDDLFK